MISGEFLLSAFSIFMINLVLSGDNAVVISLAIKNMPREMRKKVALFASLGAIILRIIIAVFVVYLLQIKFLNTIGGIVLIWITYGLIKSSTEEETDFKGANRFWKAVWTIIIADLSMSFDNVIGIAGAASGNPWLVIFGLALSIPILIFGSTWLSSIMNRWPIIIYIGAMILLHTATNMILNDQAFHFQSFLGNDMIYTTITWIIPLPVLLYGIYVTKKSTTKAEMKSICSSSVNMRHHT